MYTRYQRKTFCCNKRYTFDYFYHFVPRDEVCSSLEGEFQLCSKHRRLNIEAIEEIAKKRRSISSVTCNCGDLIIKFSNSTAIGEVFIDGFTRVDNCTNYKEAKKLMQQIIRIVKLSRA